MQDKFLLHLGEAEAIKEFEGLLNETSYLRVCLIGCMIWRSTSGSRRR